jgi:hypothetical protein
MSGCEHFYVSGHLTSYQPVLLVASSSPGHLVIVFKMPVIYIYPSWHLCFDITIDFSSSMTMLHLMSTVVSRGRRNYPSGQDYITDKSGHISEADRLYIFAYPRQLSDDCLKTALVNIIDSPTVRQSDSPTVRQSDSPIVRARIAAYLR